MLDAVDARVQHLVQGVFSEAVRCYPGTFVVCRLDGIAYDGGRKGRRQVAGAPVNPVPHELDPAVAVARLLADGLHEAPGLHFLGEPPQVAARPGDMAPRPDQHREVPAALHPAGICRRARIPDQQGSGVEVRACLVPGGRGFDRTSGTQPNVAVGVHEAREHPAVQNPVRSSRRPAERKPAVHGPEPVPHRVRCSQDGAAEVDDACHGAPFDARPG